MKSIFLLFIILSYQQIICGQCIISSSDGYDVEITVNPQSIIAPSTCPWGYNFNVEIAYNVTFSGTSIPGSLYTLQGRIDCGSFTNMFFNLPNNGGTGSTNTNTNPYNPNSDCATATPSSLNCNIVEIEIAGPGISNQFVNCPISPLPIELYSFNTYLNENNYTDISWQTLSEINNDFFTVQRSRDAINWETLIKIDGAGNSSQLLNYATHDLFPFEGTSYYRLKQTDFDGQYSYSRIKTINNIESKTSKITVYPNPTKNSIFIRGDRDEISIINIYNIFGQDISKFITITNELNHTSIDLSKLSKGWYILKTRTAINNIYRE